MRFWKSEKSDSQFFGLFCWNKNLWVIRHNNKKFRFWKWSEFQTFANFVLWTKILVSQKFFSSFAFFRQNSEKLWKIMNQKFSLKNFVFFWSEISSVWKVLKFSCFSVFERIRDNENYWIVQTTENFKKFWRIVNKIEILHFLLSQHKKIEKIFGKFVYCQKTKFNKQTKRFWYKKSLFVIQNF